MSRTSRSSVLTTGLLSCRTTSHNSPRSVLAHPRTSIISSGTPGPSAACCWDRTPGTKFVQRLADLGGAGGELFLAERGQAYPVAGVNLAVPLLHPRLQLRQPRDERNKPVVVPAILFPIPDDQRQRERLLSMIPPSPAKQRRRISLPARIRVENEPLFGHIELAPRLPIRALPEVGGAVLRRYGDGADLLSCVLAALELPRLLPRLTPAQPRILVPVRG